MSEEGEVSMARMCAVWQHMVDARRRKLGNQGGKYWVDRSVDDGLCQHALSSHLAAGRRLCGSS